MDKNIIQNSKQLNIDFKKINEIALRNSEQIVISLLPGGKREGDEWVALNPKRADQSLGSFKVNLRTGLWGDFATGDTGGGFISLVAFIKGIEQIEAAKSLASELNISLTEKAESPTPPKTKSQKQSDKIVPTPAKTEPNFFHPKYNREPDQKWAYFDSQGRIVFWVCRFDHADGSKDILPLTHGVLNGKEGWYWKWISENRPLYNLPGLIANNRPVLIVQGEKTAEIARQRLGNDYCVITSSGGDKRVHQTDWTPLKNKDVLLWPDNDDSGIKSAQNVARILLKDVGAKSVRIVDIPRDKLLVGWDLADPVPENVNIEILLRNAPLVTKAPSDLLGASEPFGYFLTETHWQASFESKEEGEFYADICKKFKCLGETKSITSKDVGIFIEWTDTYNETRSQIIPRGRLVGRESSDLLKELENAGIGLVDGHEKKVVSLLRAFKPINQLFVSDKIGWVPNMSAYILTDETFGDQKYKYHGNSNNIFKRCGELSDFNEKIVPYAYGNSRLTFALSMSFLAPLLKIIGIGTFGVNFHSDSKIGKSTMQYVAICVWSDPAFRKLWRASANGIEGVAVERNDAFLPIDEIHLIAAIALDMVIYFLAEGESKNCMNADRSLKQKKEWNIAYLSSGEKSSITKLKEGGIEPQAGQLMRLIDIPAKPENSHGLYEYLHGFKDVAEFSMHLQEQCKKFYGVAIREYLKVLVQQNFRDIEEKYKTFIKEFFDHPEIKNFLTNEQNKHVARCLGSVGFAGTLAKDFGIFNLLPSKKDANQSAENLPENYTPKDAAVTAMKDWMAAHERDEKTSEETTIIKNVIAFFAKEESRFPYIEQTDIYKYLSNPDTHQMFGTYKRAGFKVKKNDGTYHLVEDYAFTDEICQKGDYINFAKTLIKHGYMVKDKGRKGWKKNEPIGNDNNGRRQTKRFYVFTPKVFSFDDKSDDLSEIENIEACS